MEEKNSPILEMINENTIIALQEMIILIKDKMVFSPEWELCKTMIFAGIKYYENSCKDHSSE